VPRIRLRVEERVALASCTYREPRQPSAPHVPLPLLRLTVGATIRAAPGIKRPGRTTTALIDTGCWLSVIERNAWHGYEAAGLIEHLPFGDTNSQTTFVAGQATEFRLGRIWVALIDPTPTGINALPAVPVIAQLLQQPTPLLDTYPLILGLHRGVLDDRKLTREVVAQRPAPLATDRGAWYGQEWYLESP
jgi:hypothetical protein